MITPRPLTRVQVQELVNKLEEGGIRTTCWKRKLIFFQLQYWELLFVRHNLDVMHIEKNICNSLLGTLLNISGKIKDGLNAQFYIVEMGIRTELALTNLENGIFLLAACFTFSEREKKKFLQDSFISVSS